MFLKVLIPIFAFVCYISLYLILSNVPVVEVLKNEQIKTAAYSEKETALLTFIKNNLMNEKGEIITNLRVPGNEPETLSESIGLLMEYSVLKDRKDIFDTEFSCLKEKLLVDNTYIKWKAGDGNTTCNAVIDDLRITRALLDAYDKWGDVVYRDTAGFIQEGIYESQAEERNLYEFYDWKYKKSMKTIPLCYLDLYTISLLEPFNKGWVKVGNAGLSTIRNGRISEASPLLNKYFDYHTNQYGKDEEYKKTKEICFTYTAYTMLHLAEINEDTEFFTKWLKDEMGENKKLYAWYNPQSLKASQQMESTAVYALCAMYADKVGETKLYNNLINRMLNFMVTEKKSHYYGGFGNAKSGEFYSFDNLTALLALAKARE